MVQVNFKILSKNYKIKKKIRIPRFKYLDDIFLIGKFKNSDNGILKVNLNSSLR